MGCSLVESSRNDPMGMPLPNLDFSYIEPYRVLNGAVEIKQNFAPDAKTQAALESFIKEPHEIINDYAYSRFVTEEHLPVRMVFTIEKASLHKHLSHQGLVGFITGASQDIYQVDILITMSEVELNGQIKKPYNISMSRQLSIAENLTLAERDFRQFEFLEKMMRDIDLAVNDVLFKKMK
jgi:hypothetical protein